MREGEDLLDYIKRLFDEGWCGLCTERRHNGSGTCDQCEAEIDKAMSDALLWAEAHPVEAATRRQHIYDRLNEKLVAVGYPAMPPLPPYRGVHHE